MTGPCCRKKRGKAKKHTPIRSEAQRGMFGAELRRRRVGQASQMSGITTAELESHLHEAKGKTLPEYAHAKPKSRRGGNMYRKHYSKLRKENSYG